MRLRALLENDALGLRLLGGEDELDRGVRGVMTTDLRDPSRYLSGGELVLTGLAWRRSAEDSEPFVRILAGARVAALAAGEAELGAVPADLVEACARHRMPLLAVHESVAFATITEYVVRQVSGERAGDLAAVVDRHRRLMTPGPAGGGPDAVLDLLSSDLDLRAWVLSPTGRLIAGAAGALPPGAGPELAREHLAATRTGRPAPHRATAGGTTYSLFPVGAAGSRGEGAGDTRADALSGWLLAVEADAGEWAGERLDLLQGVTQLIAVERDRREAARAVRRRLAQEVLELVQSGAAPAEIAARLRVAAPVLLPGLGAAPHWQMVVARVEWDGTAGSPSEAAGAAGTSGASGVSGASGTAGETGEAGEAAGRLAQSLLEEILADPAGSGGGTGDGAGEHIAVAHLGAEAVALVPLSAPPVTSTGAADSTGGPDGGAGLHAETLLSAVGGPLAAGLGDDGRLTVGVSAAVSSAEGLRGALEEARHARRVAAARPGQVCAAGHHELASHVLLLPFVPDDVRRAFTARLLDPLREYDRRHRAELIPTLDAFLESDGSWTRCAQRLHLHVNTLRYRIGRIEQLTGRDLSRLEDKLDFFLALRMS
ncbi:PucR family transcriptional regulator ligand-binding domain-containing protein [Streptomyces sp. NPDC000594]|uniref:PucR family transcriptional regulator n=1 Tax=Streptomyces sp. NPDC000594 TaxID=3154261 RepID=UPI0033190CCA